MQHFLQDRTRFLLVCKRYSSIWLSNWICLIYIDSVRLDILPSAKMLLSSFRNSNVFNIFRSSERCSQDFVKVFSFQFPGYHLFVDAPYISSTFSSCLLSIVCSFFRVKLYLIIFVTLTGTNFLFPSINHFVFRVSCCCLGIGSTRHAPNLPGQQFRRWHYWEKYDSDFFGFKLCTAGRFLNFQQTEYFITYILNENKFNHCVKIPNKFVHYITNQNSGFEFTLS